MIGKANPSARSGKSSRLAAALLLAIAAAGCTSASRPELSAIGSELTPAKLDFAALSADANRAHAAYAEEAQIRADYPKTVRIATPGTNRVRYFLEQDDARKVQRLSIRGTANKKNLHESVEARLRPDRPTGVPLHAGFDQDARAIYDDVKPLLKKGYETQLTGHSLGGAVAAIVAIYAIEDGYSVTKVVTFGQPRFTTSKGVGVLGFLPLLRVVDENDIIPMLPPSVPNRKNGPYDQVGPEVILLEGPRYAYLASHDASRVSVGEFWRTMGIADLPDHRMENYLLRLSEKRKGAVEVPYGARETYSKRPAAKPLAVN